VYLIERFLTHVFLTTKRLDISLGEEQSRREWEVGVLTILWVF
jgi:hypothetical protein